MSTVPPGGPTAGNRAYWSARNGRRAVPVLTRAQVLGLFGSLFVETETRGDFQEHFGYWCVDEGEVPGKFGPRVNDRLLLVLGHENVWPADKTVETWSDDTLFDMVEFMFDHVSRGVEGRNHTFGQCGMHYSSFQAAPAQADFRARANELLTHLEPPYELTAAGEVVRTVPDGVAPLLTTAPRHLPKTQADMVNAAITKYRAHRSTTTDRRDAVRDLADVLENLRVQVKEQMPQKDEAMLFQIANTFWIRHNKPNERREYDHEAWWAWLFYVYLASIALVTHITDRDGTSPHE